MQNEPTLTSGAILRRGSLRAAIYDRLTRSLGKEPETATPRDIYDALSLAVREEMSARWLATQRRVARARVKRLCYLSVEFLPGAPLMITTSPAFSVSRVTPVVFNCPVPPHSTL